jgi:S-adenosylmethionine hydrolase
VSRTFHGRDVFAPVAAHLATGIPPASFGPTIADPKSLPFPPPDEEAERLRGQVVWVDRFGNCITNLSDKVVSGWAKGASYAIQAASKRIAHISTSYDSLPEGGALAIFNSMGFLEIACNQERADRTLGLAEGDSVVLERADRRDRREGNA